MDVCNEKNIDIYNYDRRLESTLRLMHSSSISKKNKKLIEKFSSFCFANSIAKRNPDNIDLAYEQATHATPHVKDMIKALAESDHERWLFLEKDGKMMVAAEKTRNDIS